MAYSARTMLVERQDEVSDASERIARGHRVRGDRRLHGHRVLQLHRRAELLAGAERRGRGESVGEADARLARRGWCEGDRPLQRVDRQRRERSASPTRRSTRRSSRRRSSARRRRARTTRRTRRGRRTRWTRRSRAGTRWRVKASRAGIPIYSHSHQIPWSFLLDTGPRDEKGYTRSSGIRVMDYFLKHTDAKWVKCEFDLFWAHVAQHQFHSYTAADGSTVEAAFDPAKQVASDPSRYVILHAKDGIRAPKTPEGWVICPVRLRRSRRRAVRARLEAGQRERRGGAASRTTRTAATRIRRRRCATSRAAIAASRCSVSPAAWVRRSTVRRRRAAADASPVRPSGWTTSHTRSSAPRWRSSRSPRARHAPHAAPSSSPVWSRRTFPTRISSTRESPPRRSARCCTTVGTRTPSPASRYSGWRWRRSARCREFATASVRRARASGC